MKIQEVRQLQPGSEVVVSGTITKVKPPSGQYNNQSFTLTDGEKSILVQHTLGTGGKGALANADEGKRATAIGQLRHWRTKFDEENAQTGRTINVKTTIKPDSGDAVPQAAGTHYAAQSPALPANNRDMSICRQVAFKGMIELAKGKASADQFSKHWKTLRVPMQEMAEFLVNGVSQKEKLEDHLSSIRDGLPMEEITEEQWENG